MSVTRTERKQHGISVYILGIEDKKYLAEVYGKQLGKASVFSDCDFNLSVKMAVVRKRNLPYYLPRSRTRMKPYR